MKRNCGIILLLFSCYFFSGCVKPSSSPPTPYLACAKLATVTYNCGADNPGLLLFFGKGALKLSVMGDNPVQFSQLTKYRPNNWSAPEMTVQNGTIISGGQGVSPSSPSSDLRFDVPNSGSYTIKAYYTEYGLSYPDYTSTGNTTVSCFNPPGVNQCYRWYKMLSLAGGTYPSCFSSPFTIVIDKQDPAGFIGSCN